MLTFDCPERRGQVTRYVHEAMPSLYLEAYLERKLSQIPSPLRDLKTLYTPSLRIFLVDNVGVMMQGPLWFGGRPDVHIGFWDRILAGREQMCYTVAGIVAKDARAEGVFTAIPKVSRATLAFAKRVGFKVIRETSDIAVLSMDFVHDVHRGNDGH